MYLAQRRIFSWGALDSAMTEDESPYAQAPIHPCQRSRHYRCRLELDSFRVDSDFDIGQAGNGLYRFSGVLDEIQVSNTMRSREWFLTSYRNQSRPNSFTPSVPKSPRLRLELALAHVS
jgi:hypothetical protein